MTEEEKCACVVVLGDLGRSPRMQYHALSLASEGFSVDVIGYGGSEPVSELANHPKVVIRYMPDCPNIFQKCPGLSGHVFKVIWQSIVLLCYLIFKRRSHNLVVQNAPAIPTVAVCWVYCALANASFILDWHNYSYTILALKHGTKHKLVRLCEWYEGYFGRKATSNLCVTIAMKDDLEKKWGIKAVTLYDRPPESMVPLSLPERHTFFLSLSKKFPQFKNSDNASETTFTTANSENEIVPRPDRPGLLVSSTSWTEDEDFSVLLAALQDYEEACTDSVSRLPRLLCAITGKGPMKDFYCDLIKKAGWKYVDVITPWLEPGDYPKLLGSADLGVSLHTSSSGLDLPMKVVDMFGCQLPVLAYNFPCLNELVQHGKNSYKFDDSAELSRRLRDWFHDFPRNEEHSMINDSFRDQLDLFRKLRWHDNWSSTALPLITK